MNNQGTTTTNNKEITEESINLHTTSSNDEDHVTLFVAYDGKWELDGKEWLFKDSKGSIIVVPKYVTLSQITDIICTKFGVNQDFFGLKLEVYYRVGFPIIEIDCDEDLSLFIIESSKTKLLLCVTGVRKDDVVGEVEEDDINLDIKEESRHGRKDHVPLFVAYNGKWEYDGKEWFFKNFKISMMVVPKHITLSELIDILHKQLEADKEFYRLKLEVHYRTGCPWFPVIEIQNDHDLSVFISETSKTKLPLCVTRSYYNDEISSDDDEERRKDNKVEKRLFKAIKDGDWVKAREIVNTEVVTWTSKLNDDGETALHCVVGGYRDNEVFKEILMGINNELLVTTVDYNMSNPAHSAAYFGNTEALKIMFDSNPKCLFVPDYVGDLPIHYALATEAIQTFLYLFEQMKSYRVEHVELFRGSHGLKLLHQVIDAGLIYVAYELINDYPSLANTMLEDKTVLARIIRKPELFYSGTSYNFYSRFVYHVVPIENNSFGSNCTSDVENQETPKKDNFVTKHTRWCLHNVISRIGFKLWKTTLLKH